MKISTKQFDSLEKTIHFKQFFANCVADLTTVVSHTLKCLNCGDFQREFEYQMAISVMLDSSLKSFNSLIEGFQMPK